MILYIFRKIFKLSHHFYSVNSMFSKNRTDSFIVHSESKEKKHYPGFPMSQTEAIDKEKQYEIDMENSRRLLGMILYKK